MQNGKLKSFTLSEMLVVLIITAIVVGLAFSVLNLVRRQIHGIQKNMDRTTMLSLFEQRLSQDFNTHNAIRLEDENIMLTSDKDTVNYKVGDGFVLRNTDTIKAALKIDRMFYEGTEVKSGIIDAISLSGEVVVPGDYMFFSSTADATLKMNYDGI